MPNHIANKLYVKANTEEEINKFVEFIEGNNHDECIDFNTIIPMPEELKTTEESSRVTDSILYYLKENDKLNTAETYLGKTMFNISKDRDFSTIVPHVLEEMYKEGEKYVNIFDTYGYLSWYTWSINNWGTKWNAYDSYIEELENMVIIHFNTAWSGVPKIIGTMTEMFPNLSFNYKYADEDFGCNCGLGFTKNGEFEYYDIINGSDTAIETYIECWQCDPDDFYKDENGEWHNREWEL